MLEYLPCSLRGEPLGTLPSRADTLTLGAGLGGVVVEAV